MVSSSELGQTASTVDQRVVRAVVLVDDQPTVEDQRALIDRHEGVVVHLFVDETEQGLERRRCQCTRQAAAVGSPNRAFQVEIFALLGIVGAEQHTFEWLFGIDYILTAPFFHQIIFVHLDVQFS